MKTITRSLLVLLSLALLCAPPAGAQRKLAQTGMKFLSVEPDPRAAALGGAFTAIEGSSTAAFFNPAGTARLDGFGHVFLGYTEWIADIKHIFGSVSLSPFGGAFGVMTLSVQAVDYGEMEQTVFYNNFRGYLDLGTLKPTSMVLGLTYGRALSEKFSVGGGIKYVSQNLGSSMTYLNSATGVYQRSYYEASLYAFDFGILYKTGFKSLTMGMALRNFSKEARFVEEGFQLPLTFRFGFSMNALDLMELDPKEHGLLVVVDFEHPRDYDEQVKVGAEYVFMQTVAVRGGYVFPADEHGFTWGVGLRQSVNSLGVGMDYAYTPFGIFGGVHRVALSFTM